ncbi:hypothetical protein CRI94_16030 [Longibacter salinarum]|uniref:DUF2306 domain-containing protein n=1 Tax=Longibacter salinarum TaxID=1850348 RepID=A0A2A8CTV6_9BACT|nr:hypothetical protein [Longibacter salinarum]PEN11298.1 hypothetical protein CRI94_16030 [Longibacter salinarum]
MLVFHTVSGVAALLLGIATCVLSKGTTLHKRVGWMYGASMYSLCLSSLFIPADILTFARVGGLDYGIFHVFAFWGMIQLSVGLYIMIRREAFDHPVEWHLYNMLWSVVGLIMATNSHLFQYIGPWVTGYFGVSVGWSVAITGLVLWGLPATIGAIWIERLRPVYRDSGVDAVPAGY